MSEQLCGFDCGWAGTCKNSVEDDCYCDEHKNLKCSSCGEKATRLCDYTGIQFVCGSPLCDNCRHGIPKKGEEGMFCLCGGHVTKEVHEQQFEDYIASRDS